MTFTPERREALIFPQFVARVSHKETRMKTLVWAGLVVLPFLDPFWWLR